MYVTSRLEWPLIGFFLKLCMMFRGLKSKKLIELDFLKNLILGIVPENTPKRRCFSFHKKINSLMVMFFGFEYCTIITVKILPNYTPCSGQIWFLIYKQKCSRPIRLQKNQWEIHFKTDNLFKNPFLLKTHLKTHIFLSLVGLSPIMTCYCSHNPFDPFDYFVM